MNHNKGTSWLMSGLMGAAIVGALLFPALPAAAAGFYFQSNLVSDIPGLAIVTDPNLKNPWGISHSSTSPFWVSDNGTGLSTLYNGAGKPFPVASPLVVTIPPPAGSSAGTVSAPTGQVFNGTSDFLLSPGSPARFIFGTEDGTISGWNGGTSAVLKVDNSAAGAVYKGLALGNNGSGNFLYAANFTGGTIDVFDTNFSPTTLLGNFTDPTLPAGYAPFNAQNLGGHLFVTYALQNGKDDLPGPGHGFVDMFDLNGSLERRLISGGVLNSPWGLAMAPANFGEFSKDLLVGNFGDGSINAFDPATGNFLGPLRDKNGTPIFIDGLWGLILGNGGNGGDLDKIYFSAGLNDEVNGLFGSLAAVPVPPTFILLGSGLVGLLRFARARKKGA